MPALLIQGGTLVDPANGRHGPTDLLFEDGRVAAVGPGLPAPRGSQVVDARGLLVLPGLVDTHVHLAAGYWPGHAMMARVGVTTALNLSGRMQTVLDGIRARGTGLTIASLDSVEPGANLSGPAPSTAEIDAALDQAVESGALGVKILGGHYPFTPEATAEIIRVANQRRAYVAFHVGTTAHGSNLEGLRQAAELADGRSLHVAHVNSYCRGLVLDALSEAREAVEILLRWPKLRSESYLALINGVPGRCVNGEPASNMLKTCLRTRGYEPTAAGLERAVLDGYAFVAAERGDENALLRGEEGLAAWREFATNVDLCFPVNDPTAQFILATARRPDGSFAVDALSTDGGGIPRNVTLDRGLALVAYGALSLADFVTKASLNPARLLGLSRKGQLGVGADADAILVDLATRRVRATYALGRPVMLDGVVVGSGGTIITTVAGERQVRASGLPYQVVDLEQSTFYAPGLLASQPDA